MRKQFQLDFKFDNPITTTKNSPRGSPIFSRNSKSIFSSQPSYINSRVPTPSPIIKMLHYSQIKKSKQQNEKSQLILSNKFNEMTQKWHPITSRNNELENYYQNSIKNTFIGKSIKDTNFKDLSPNHFLNDLENKKIPISETYNFIGVKQENTMKLQRDSTISAKKRLKIRKIINCKDLIGLNNGKIALLSIRKNSPIEHKLPEEIALISHKMNYENRPRPLGCTVCKKLDFVLQKAVPKESHSSNISLIHEKNIKEEKTEIIIPKRKSPGKRIPIIMKKAIKPIITEHRKSLSPMKYEINFGNKI